MSIGLIAAQNEDAFVRQRVQGPGDEPIPVQDVALPLADI
jgi:hypothetical protein